MAKSERGQSKAMLRFLLRFVLIYGFLILPWPGFDRLYDSYFNALGTLAFTREDTDDIVLFRAVHEGDHPAALTQVVLANRESLDASGRGLVKNITLDARSLGWIPTALTAALILATPISWKRRAWALLWGLTFVQAFVLFSIQVCLWDNSSDIGLVTLSSFWKGIVAEADYALIFQLGASFAAPVLIWAVVTFQRRDAKNRSFFAT